jgi:hypothetical protein
VPRVWAFHISVGDHQSKTITRRKKYYMFGFKKIKNTISVNTRTYCALYLTYTLCLNSFEMGFWGKTLLLWRYGINYLTKLLVQINNEEDDDCIDHDISV